MVLPVGRDDTHGPLFAVLGMGNGGQAMAGFLALSGFGVNAWNRSYGKVAALRDAGGIRLEGEIRGFAAPRIVTTDIREAIDGARVIMVAVPASAHRDIARMLAPHLDDGQIVVLNPGRTGGALAFRKAVLGHGCRPGAVVAEANTFVYASRTIAPGLSKVYGVKDRVTVAALPASRTDEVVNALKPAFPQFVPAESVLATSLDNMGALFHPLPTLLNVARFEGGEKYEHYTGGISPSVARLLEKMDLERMAIGRALGVRCRSALDWLRETYGVTSSTLYEAVQENRSYHGIYAPESLDTRYVHEDVPFSLVPLVCLAEFAGVDAPVMASAVSMAEGLTGQDFRSAGRDAGEMGISSLNLAGLQSYVMEGSLEYAQ